MAPNMGRSTVRHLAHGAGNDSKPSKSSHSLESDCRCTAEVALAPALKSLRAQGKVMVTF
eukprot:2556532-Pyramimonas_sp.AAC.1